MDYLLLFICASYTSDVVRAVTGKVSLIFVDPGPTRAEIR